tara:strand:- start:403 stop:1338 length:936 start_codon:yes stop_codon:yes gene_type:complete
MKIIRIPIFIFPWEMDSFQDMVDRLKLCSNFIKDNKNYKVIVDVTLNVSNKTVNWDNSTVKKEFFINSFNNICNKLNYFLPTEFVIEETDKVMGCVDKRRESIYKSSSEDYILWLDPDIYFPTHILYSMISSLDIIKDDYFILSPQIPKLWDKSWDIITNKHYINDDIEKRRTPGNEIFNCDAMNQFSLFNDEINLVPLPTFKFSGGWFNLFSAKLLIKIGIPESFGSYGEEDTFVMQNCLALKQMGKDVKQYMLENVIIGQHYLPSYGPNFEFNKLVDIKLPTKEEQRYKAQTNFNPEFQKNLNRFKNEK